MEIWPVGLGNVSRWRVLMRVSDRVRVRARRSRLESRLTVAEGVVDEVMHLRTLYSRADGETLEDCDANCQRESSLLYFTS